MATRIPVIDNSLGDSTIKATWTGMLNGDDGSPVKFPEHTIRSVQVAGTLGAGGSCRIEGSNDGGSNYAALSNQQATALDIAALAVKTIAEVPGLTRPRVTAGDGTTNLTITMMLERISRTALN